MSQTVELTKSLMPNLTSPQPLAEACLSLHVAGAPR